MVVVIKVFFNKTRSFIGRSCVWWSYGESKDGKGGAKPRPERPRLLSLTK